MLSDDDVKKILKPHHSRYSNSWRGAFTDYATKYVETRPIHSKLARAIILRDHCIDHVKRNFADRIGVDVEIVEEGNLFLVVMSGKLVGIDDTVAARLKKFNDKMLTSNIPTKQANNFNDQKPVVTFYQPSLFGEPLIAPKREPVHVNVGYRPNDVYTDVEGVYATRPNGKRSIQFFVRIDNDEGTQAVVIEMPLEQPPQEPRSNQVRIKKKSTN